MFGIFCICKNTGFVENVFTTFKIPLYIQIMLSIISSEDYLAKIEVYLHADDKKSKLNVYLLLGNLYFDLL